MENFLKGNPYGQGVYFAINTFLADIFAKPNENGRKFMFRARVIAGESCIGDYQMKVPPLKKNGDRFDSTTDKDKEIYVSFHDSQCYPEYLITYI